jgi:hypothetical protein
MQLLVDNLERAIPDLSETSHPSYGIPGALYRVSMLSEKRQFIDGMTDQTDALINSLQTMRTPIRQTFHDELSALSAESNSLPLLRQQQSLVTNLVQQLEIASPAITALLQQETLLKLHRAHLIGWRSDVQAEYRAAWKAFIIRVAILEGIIAVLLGMHTIARSFLVMEVRDHGASQMFLVGKRILSG